MLSKSEILQICRELGYDLTMSHLRYFQSAQMVDLNLDGFGGYVYAGFLSVSMVGDFANSNVVVAMLNNDNVQAFIYPDLYFNTFSNLPEGKVASSPVKFCVFDNLANEGTATCSFYGYRFRK